MNNRVSVISKGFEWLVDDESNIFSPPRSTSYTTVTGGAKVYTANFKGGAIRPCRGASGYMQVDSRRGGVKAREYVHRLVALAFVPGYSPELTVNHIDGDKLNNPRIT